MHGGTPPGAVRPEWTGSRPMRGEAVWEAMGKGSFDGGGWDPQLFTTCLCRSLTLTQAETMNHRYPTREQIQQWVKEPVVYRFQYAED